MMFSWKISTWLDLGFLFSNLIFPENSITWESEIFLKKKFFKWININYRAIYWLVYKCFTMIESVLVKVFLKPIFSKTFLLPPGKTLVRSTSNAFETHKYFFLKTISIILKIFSNKSYHLVIFFMIGIV